MSEDKIEELPLIQKLRALKAKEEAKKKELEQLETRLKTESENIKSAINKTIQELQEEDKDKFLEAEEKRKQKEQSLEEHLEDIKTPKPAAVDLESLYISKSANVYDVANHNFYNKVKDMLDKQENGYLNSDEKQFLSSVGNKLTEIRTQDSYLKNKDPDSYISRTQELLNRFRY